MSDETRTTVLLAVNALPINELSAAQRSLNGIRLNLTPIVTDVSSTELARSLQFVEHAQHLAREALAAAQRAETHARGYVDAPSEG